ncbi:ABC transporter permease [Pararobbsia silviterrae]|uniref:ABC transporter permease n=1 Tax=Pararobbsia silviterrae TaxID=1792498 RepID=A0A494XSS7_9BURK|nr:ABC transporter permease [Pararobbsia silviterrae]RKP53690.1 ABC transporter permease [Pararobbsia silviterrae]
MSLEPPTVRNVLPTAPRAPHPSIPWLSRRYTIEVRQHVGRTRQSIVVLASLIAGVLVSGAILVAAGVSAGDLWTEFVMQTLFDAQSLRAVLFEAAPLVVTGLAAAIAFRTRFWNLGLEGQMIAGAIGATAVSIYGIGPPGARLGSMMAAALVCGAAWVIVPLWLRVRLGINEIISTLMLNYVAGDFLLFLLYGSWKDPKDAFPHSPQYLSFERLPDLPGGISAALLVAFVVTAAAWWALERSRASLYLRFVHASESVSRAVGIPVRRLLIGTVLISGALAGLSGWLLCAGQEGRLTQAFYSGYGFSGVLIAFLARNHPIGACGVGFLVAMLFVAGRSLQVFYQIPFSMVQLIQAILVISVAASDFFVRHRFQPVASRIE